MPDRVVIVLTVWLTVFTGAGSLLGRYVLDIPGTLTVAGFLIAVVTTFLWPWIMPGPIDRWMDGGAAAERYDSWAEQGRNVVPGVRGEKPGQRDRVIEDALAVEEAGAFAVVLEGIPMDLAAELTERLTIPTVGIGAGPHCDGQILVLHDVLGLNDSFKPKFAKRYAELWSAAREAVPSKWFFMTRPAKPWRAASVTTCASSATRGKRSGEEWTCRSQAPSTSSTEGP